MIMAQNESTSHCNRERKREERVNYIKGIARGCDYPMTNNIYNAKSQLNL